MGNGSVPQQVGPDQPTLEEACRMIKEALEACYRRIDKMRECTEERRSMNQCLIRLEHDARQPRLAMDADGLANTKICQFTEAAATSVQAMHGDDFSASRVDPGPRTGSTTFGGKAEPPALPRRDDVLVENGAAAPNSCLPSLKMRSPTAAVGLLPTGEAAIATMTPYNQPLLRLYSTKEMDSKKTKLRTRILSSRMTAVSCLLPPLAGGSSTLNQEKIGCSILAVQGRPRACPFPGSWRASLCGEVHVTAE